MPQQMSAYAT